MKLIECYWCILYWNVKAFVDQRFVGAHKAGFTGRF